MTDTKALVARLRAVKSELYEGEIYDDVEPSALELAAADALEALTAPVDVDVDELAIMLNNSRENPTLCKAAATTLRRLSRENVALRDGVEKARREILASQHSAPDRPGLMYWNDAMRKALAILDQHFPEPEGER